MPASLSRRDESDPARRAVELAQRGRMILDVATADLEAAEEALGPFHPTAWHFRQALAEAKMSWDRLRAEFGGARVEAALAQPPVAVLILGNERPDQGEPRVVLIPISGKTYRAQAVSGTTLAPTQWRLTRLAPPLEHGPYYVCRLRDGSTQCDCAEWLYQDNDPPHPCKHLGALAALGWI
jgi:hypothetical protein